MLPIQCKMARTALGLGVRDLAALATVSPDTIARLERGEALYPRTIAAIRAALETAGVIFIEENGEGPGVRLRNRAGLSEDRAYTKALKLVTEIRQKASASSGKRNSKSKPYRRLPLNSNK